MNTTPRYAFPRYVLKNTPYHQQMSALERGLIQSALDAAGGSWSKAASLLGVKGLFLRRRGNFLEMREPRKYVQGHRARAAKKARTKAKRKIAPAVMEAAVEVVEAPESIEAEGTDDVTDTLSDHSGKN